MVLISKAPQISDNGLGVFKVDIHAEMTVGRHGAFIVTVFSYSMNKQAAEYTMQRIKPGDCFDGADDLHHLIYVSVIKHIDGHNIAAA